MKQQVSAKKILTLHILKQILAFQISLQKAERAKNLWKYGGSSNFEMNAWREAVTQDKLNAIGKFLAGYIKLQIIRASTKDDVSELHLFYYKHFRDDKFSLSFLVEVKKGSPTSVNPDITVNDHDNLRISNGYLHQIIATNFGISVKHAEMTVQFIAECLLKGYNLLLSLEIGYHSAAANSSTQSLFMNIAHKEGST